jgi:hypothetical protein
MGYLENNHHGILTGAQNLSSCCEAPESSFAEFILSEERFFASLRMTRGEGLTMTIFDTS